MDPTPTAAPAPMPSAYSQSSSGRRSNLLLIVAIAVLFVVALVLAAIMVVALGQADTARTTLDQQKQAAAAAARADQKKADTAATTAAAESPYRSYTAPSEFGSFVISFPKNWQSYVEYSHSSVTQLDLFLHPDLIQVTDNTPQPLACHISLLQNDLSTYLQQYHNVEQITQKDITVSGIKGKELSGITGSVRLIAIPVRDKTLLFSSEDKAYASEFSTILSRAKIVP